MTSANALVLRFEANHTLSAPLYLNFSQEILKRFLLCLCDESVEKCTAVTSNMNENNSTKVFASASTNKSLDKSHHRYRKNLLCKSQLSLNSTVWEFRFTCSNSQKKCPKKHGGINLKAFWDTGSSLGNTCLACGLNIFWNDSIREETYNKSLLNIIKRCEENKNKSRKDTGKEQDDSPDNMTTSPMTLAAKNNSFCQNLFKALESVSSPSLTIQKQSKSLKQTTGVLFFESTTVQSAVTNQSDVTNQSVELTTVNGNTIIDVPRTYGNDTGGIKLNVALQEQLLKKVENDGVGNYSASKEKTSSSPTLMIAASITGAVTLCALIAVIVFVAVRRKKKALQSARRYSLPRSQSLDETKKSMEV
ncbi:hypothetical protein BgiBS90_029082 [Biomphalaria glabrata]|nr:hypothetical protein BgiBS90_029082 [Biomphalaria glabrata]